MTHPYTPAHRHEWDTVAPRWGAKCCVCGHPALHVDRDHFNVAGIKSVAFYYYCDTCYAKATKGDQVCTLTTGASQ